jgi:hypothetical protein
MGKGEMGKDSRFLTMLGLLAGFFGRAGLYFMRGFHNGASKRPF